MKNIPLEQIMKDAKKCNKTVKVSDVADVMENGFSALYQSGTILKKVQAKVGDEDFNTLITSLLSTFITTIYANANFETQEEMLEYAAKVNASKVYGVRK